MDELPTVTRGKPITTEELAYVAGLVDADGHIGICKNSMRPTRYWNPRYQAEVVVTNNHRPVLDWLQSLFGGSVGLRKQVKPHHKPTYRYKAGDVLGARMCEQIIPYLKIKRRQAELLVEFQSIKTGPTKRGQGARLSDEQVARYEAIYRRYKALNDDRRPQRLSGGGSDEADASGPSDSLS